MAFFRSLTTVFLAAILVVSLSALTVGVALIPLLKSQTYTNALEANNGYAELEAALGINDLGIDLDDARFKSIINEAINKTIGALKDDSQNFDITIDVSEDIKDFLLHRISDLPTCTNAGQLLYEECIPPGFSAEQVLEQQLASQGISMQELGAIRLTDVIGRETLENARAAVKTYYNVLYALVFVVALSIILMFLVQKRKTAVEIIDAELAFTALTMFLVSFYVNSNIQNLFSYDLPLKNTLLTILQAVLQTMTYFGIGMVLLGALISAGALMVSIEARKPVKPRVLLPGKYPNKKDNQIEPRNLPNNGKIQKQK